MTKKPSAKAVGFFLRKKRDGFSTLSRENVEKQYHSAIFRGKIKLYGCAFPAQESMVTRELCAGLRLLDLMLPDKNGLFLQWMMYAFAAVLYVMGIVSAAGTPEELSVSFIAFMLAVPLLFVMPPIHHMANVLLFDAIFIVTMLLTEEGHTLSIDIVDAVFFGQCPASFPPLPC